MGKTIGTMAKTRWHVVDVIEHIAWIHRHHHIVCWRCGGSDGGMVVVWMIPQSAAHMIGWHVVDVIEHIAWIHRHHHIVCWRCGGNDESMQMKIRRVWRAEQAAGALGLLKGLERLTEPQDAHGIRQDSKS